MSPRWFRYSSARLSQLDDNWGTPVTSESYGPMVPAWLKGNIERYKIMFFFFSHHKIMNFPYFPLISRAFPIFSHPECWFPRRGHEGLGLGGHFCHGVGHLRCQWRWDPEPGGGQELWQLWQLWGNTGWAFTVHQTKMTNRRQFFWWTLWGILRDFENRWIGFQRWSFTGFSGWFSAVGCAFLSIFD